MVVTKQSVIPPRTRKSNSGSDPASNKVTGMASGIRGSGIGSASGMGGLSGVSGEKTSVGTTSGVMSSGLNMFGSVMNFTGFTSALPHYQKKRGFRQSDAQMWKQMKAEFLEEMRYLSKLRHPCITTVSWVMWR